MTIDELIFELEALKKEIGGEVDVTVWQYAGGNDVLCDVRPVFDNNYGRVILETTWTEDRISR